MKKIIEENTQGAIKSSEHENQPSKDRWYRKKSVRITAICLAVILVLSEVTMHYASSSTPVPLDPQSLMNANLQERLKDPTELEKFLSEIEYQSEEQRQKLLDACERAEKLIAEGKYEEALEPLDYLMTEMQMTEEEELQMKMTRTALTFACGRFKETRTGCTELIDAGQDSTGYYHFIRSICDIQEGQYETAATDIRKALELGYEDEALCYVHLTFCENYLGNYEQVLEYAKKAKESEAEEVYLPTLTYLQAIASLQTGRYEDCISYTAELLKEDAYKEVGELYYFKGNSEMALERYQEAYDDFSTAIKYGVEQNSESSEEGTGDMLTLLYYNRGVSALALNKTKEARSDLQKVVERNDNAELTANAKELLAMFDSV